MVVFEVILKRTLVNITVDKVLFSTAVKDLYFYDKQPYCPMVYSMSLSKSSINLVRKFMTEVAYVHSCVVGHMTLLGNLPSSH